MNDYILIIIALLGTGGAIAAIITLPATLKKIHAETRNLNADTLHDITDASVQLINTQRITIHDLQTQLNECRDTNP